MFLVYLVSNFKLRDLSFMSNFITIILSLEFWSGVYTSYSHLMTTSKTAVYTVNTIGAFCLAVLFAAFFVLSLYVWALCRYNITDRNNQLVIKQRIISVLCVCLICPLILSYYVGIIDINPNDSKQNGAVTNSMISVLFSYAFWESLGFRFDYLFKAIFYSFLLVLILFLGPLLENPKLPKQNWDALPNNLQRIRSILVAPIAEEWVYRACICSVLYYGNWSVVSSMILSPALFGLCMFLFVFFLYIFLLVYIIFFGLSMF